MHVNGYCVVMSLINKYCDAAVAYAQIASDIWNDLSDGLSPRKKGDGTLVTSADLAIEKELRLRIERDFPDHGIVGEEFSTRNPDADYCWYLDPIDGTEELAYGLPYWGTVIALRKGGEPVIGVLNHPAMGICCVGVKGGGSFCNGEKLSIADKFPITDKQTMLNTKEIRLALNAPVNYLRTQNGMSLFHKLADVFPNIRIYRSCFAHMCVATSKMHAMIEINVSAWDIAATQIIIEEAGGTYVPISIDGMKEGSIISERDFREIEFHSAVFGQSDVVKECIKTLNSR